MKVLVLTIHPRLEDTNLNPEEIRQGRITTRHLGLAKRLTDAELAAEAWAAQCNRRVRNYDPTRDIPGVTWEWEHNIMARFATLPHYDEAPATNHATGTL